MHKNIERYLRKVAAARLNLRKAVRAEQRKCKHPQAYQLTRDGMRTLRQCVVCGYEEWAWSFYPGCPVITPFKHDPIGPQSSFDVTYTDRGGKLHSTSVIEVEEKKFFQLRTRV